MEGPVLSGGVIVLVSVALWLLYLVPSWKGRHQFYAVERNAVRLNQAIRVLAETSETPEEVRLELNTRSAHAQQRLAKRVQAERESAELALLRAELAATKADPAVRQARARRRTRIAATVLLLGGLALAGVGVWQLIGAGTVWMVAAGAIAAALAALVLQRMAVVAARGARREVPPVVVAQTPRAAPVLHDQGPAPWTPRRLPEPLTSVAGSRAQIAQASAQAQRERQAAAQAEELRRRAERMAPPAPTPLPAEAPAASAYAKMGYVDDAEIEAHVRQLLARRAAG